MIGKYSATQFTYIGCNAAIKRQHISEIENHARFAFQVQALRRAAKQNKSN